MSPTAENATLNLLRRLEASLRAVGAQGRETLAVGPFELFVSASPEPLMSFAVPREADASWREAAEALRAAFQARERRPRLEYFHELHPTLADALEGAGFNRESAAPVMTLEPGGLAPPPPTPQGSYLSLADDPEVLEAFLERQNLAYGGIGDEGALAWLPGLGRGLKNGGVVGGALLRGGDLVAGATVQIGGGAGELAGVWALPTERRRGLAFEVCQRLLSNYFAGGNALCWLSAAEGAERLYEKLGFERVGTQLNYAHP